MKKIILKDLYLGLIFIALSMIYCSSSNNNKKEVKSIDTINDIVINNNQNNPQHGIIPLKGTIGNSAQWKSGFLKLNVPFNFKNGDSLIISVGGTARKVLVRLLPQNEDPNSPVEIIGNGENVINGKVKIKLIRDYNAIIQVSVHGGPNPWDTFPLGNNNGTATLQSAFVKR